MGFWQSCLPFFYSTFRASLFLCDASLPRIHEFIPSSRVFQLPWPSPSIPLASACLYWVCLGRLRTECGLIQTGTSLSGPTPTLSLGLPEGILESLVKGHSHPTKTPLKLLGRGIPGRHLLLIICIGVWGCLTAFKMC